MWDVQSDYASSPARVSRSFSSSVMMSRPVQPSSLGRQPSSIGRVRQRKETKYSATLNVYHPSILTIKDFKKHREKGVRMSPSYPPSQETVPQFFIIESLGLEDENEDRFEGKFLYNYLKILNKKPIYFYIRSRRELHMVADQFRQSRYRYLYLSCHGDKEAIYTTCDRIIFEDFASIFNKKLEHRRLFVSGCSVGQLEFAQSLFEKNGGMYSLTAPKKDVPFTQTLPFWTSFYYLMESIDSKSMKSATIYPSLQLCANMFDIDIVHFFKHPRIGITSNEFISNNVFSKRQLNKILKLKRST